MIKMKWFGSLFHFILFYVIKFFIKVFAGHLNWSLFLKGILAFRRIELVLCHYDEGKNFLMEGSSARFNVVFLTFRLLLLISSKVLNKF